MLQQAAAIRLDDNFEFRIGEAREELNGAPEAGSRYPSQAAVEGREFARFRVDVGIGDEVLEPLDIVTGEDWLGFAGGAPSSFPVISAEKLRAYTLPRGERVNMRTKGLIDMELLVREEQFEKDKVRAAIQATFERRTTHSFRPILKHLH